MIHPQARWFGAGIAAGIAVALAVAVIAAFGFAAIGPGAAPTAAPGEAAVPTPAPVLAVLPGQVEMPPDADCTACHLTSGGFVGLNPIPAIAHPTQGWSNCTACHSTDRLVPTARGHDGIHANECTICHKSDTAAAPSRPHPQILSAGCLQCHGTTAPLPAGMVGRSDTTCWLCHRATTDASLTLSVSR